MDNFTLGLLVASYIFIAAQDNLVAWYWAARIGPAKARALIMSDPVFAETRDMLSTYKGELAEVRHDMRSLREFIDKTLATVSKDIRSSTDEAVKGLPKAISDMELRMQAKLDVLSASATSVVIPETEISRVSNSIKATMRRSLQDGDLLEGMEKVLDEKLKALPQGDDLEALLTDAELNTTEGKQDTYEWLVEKGLPEAYAFRVADKGPMMVRKVAKLKGWNILEILEAGE